MDFLNSPLLQMLTTRMAYTGERQAVLSSNLANIDTPGYRPRDLEKLSFKDLLVGGASRLPMAVTSPAHIGKPGGFTTTFDIITQAQTFETKPNGNQVSLEDQVEKMAENQSDSQISTNLYQKMIGLYNMALGARG